MRSTEVSAHLTAGHGVWGGRLSKEPEAALPVHPRVGWGVSHLVMRALLGLGEASLCLEWVFSEALAWAGWHRHRFGASTLAGFWANSHDGLAAMHWHMLCGVRARAYRTRRFLGKMPARGQRTRSNFKTTRRNECEAFSIFTTMIGIRRVGAGKRRAAQLALAAKKKAQLARLKSLREKANRKKKAAGVKKKKPGAWGR